MSLQRRLLLYLLICAPLVWGVALYESIKQARFEVNELYDAELIRLARQVQATLRPEAYLSRLTKPPQPAKGGAETGTADVRDLALAVWDAGGTLVLSDSEGVQLNRYPDAVGFRNEKLRGKPWRIYYLQSTTGAWLVAAGQRVKERDELVYSVTASQITPWILVLPALLIAMAWAVRRALAPLRELTTELQARDATDLRLIPNSQAPTELKPLVQAMNGLFQRIEETLARERRFTADAAHELRTPLAVLRAQWDVVRRSAGGAEREQAEAKLSRGLDRLDRLVTQMLALSRLESSAELNGQWSLTTPVQWPGVVEQAISDCLPVAERRHIELDCEWPPEGVSPLPLNGDTHLLTVLLRNLLDNAVRYAPEGTLVTLRVLPDRLEVANDGAPLPGPQIARMGERFYRPDGQQEFGSGLGVSIVQRIAALHGLTVTIGARADGTGVQVTLQPVASRPPAPNPPPEAHDSATLAVVSGP
ncbi:MAG: sensor histidine kinase N-terminal domain-containing protein [Burkholderiaceae bacterium]|nr:sensor histidine kinase N-terminal domain-containing protein [Burkholderiaceae bacterium]